MEVNFLAETQKALKTHGYKMRNIVQIQNAEGYIPIAQFEEKAYETVYDPTSAQTEIDPSLVIIGKFWWMTRERDSDGTEGWFFHKKPEKAALPALDYRLKTNYLTTQTCIKDKLEKGGRRNGKKQS